MAFQIPSLPDLVTRARRAFRNYLPGSDAWLWPNNLNPTAKVIGGALHEAFGFLDYIARQKFALTADTEHLDLHGAEFGVPRKPAAPARGAVLLTIVGGAQIAAGAIFRRSDAIEYRSLVTVAIEGDGTLSVDVVATSDGKLTTALAETPLEIVSGVSGGDIVAEVASGGINGGADVEDDESYRARILFRKRNPPHGGSAADYVLWASQVSGVSRVFVERLWNGCGTVRVFVLMDDLYSHGIPPSPEISRVADFIETVRPAGALVTVAAPVSVPVNITIEGLSPDTLKVREEVLAELRAAFRRLSRVAGADVNLGAMPYLATATSFSRSWIWQAIANATGEERHIVTAPTADVELTAGQIATLGTVTFAG